MKPLGNAEKWAALRALREGMKPTLALLSAASGINDASIRNRAGKDGRKKGASRGARPGKR